MHVVVFGSCGYVFLFVYEVCATILGQAKFAGSCAFFTFLISVECCSVMAPFFPERVSELFLHLRSEYI